MEQQTIRQALMPDARVEELIASRPRLINAVYAAHREVVEAEGILREFTNNGLSMLKAELAEIENDHSFEIATDRGFTNEGQRKAALKKSLQFDDKYGAKLNDIRNAEVTRNEKEHAVVVAKINLETARNNLSTWTAMMYAMAGLSNEQRQVVRFVHGMEVDYGRQEN